MNLYYYIYYRLYRWLEGNNLPWWSEVKAAFFIFMIEAMLIALIGSRLKEIFGIEKSIIDIGKTNFIIIIAGVPGILNFFVFLYQDRWKNIIERFDNVDKKMDSTV